MAAPTLPLSAFTDGFTHAVYALGYVPGALLAILILVGPLTLAYLLVMSTAHQQRHRVTAWRIRRSHRRSGR